MNNENLTYGSAIDELEDIVKAIENEDIDVDHLAEKVKRASYLIQFCKTKLKNTEEEVEKVLKSIEAEGAPETKHPEQFESKLEAF